MPTYLHRWRWLAVPLLVAGLGLTLGLATPQGRTLAQSLWQFFTPAAGSSFPVPAAAVTPDALAPTAAPPAGLPGCDGQTGSAALACQVGQAEALLGFDLKTPPADLPGLVFVYATVDAERRTATVVYNAVGGGAGLSLTQGDSSNDSVVWETVPAEAQVETVRVGGGDGEYVRGTFVVYANATAASWNPDAPVQRLRWRADGRLFEINLAGAVEAVAVYDQAALIALAESLR